MNSKLLFRNTLGMRIASRPIFVPFIYGLAAQIEQILLRDMVYDPTYYANSLESAYKLFKYDGITNVFDDTIEAEAFGCEVEWEQDCISPKLSKRTIFNEDGLSDLAENERISVLLETTHRIETIVGKEVAIIGVIAGPLSIIENIIGDFGNHQEDNQRIQKTIPIIANLITKLTKRFCELRIDAVFIREDMAGVKFFNRVKLVMEAYATLFNIIRYYNCYPVIIVKDFSELKDVQNICNLLKPSGVILSGFSFAEKDLEYLKQLSESLKISIGLALPFGNQNKLWELVELANNFTKTNGPQGFFYTSDGEIPHTTAVETINQVRDKILANCKDNNA